MNTHIAPQERAQIIAFPMTCLDDNRVSESIDKDIPIDLWERDPRQAKSLIEGDRAREYQRVRIPRRRDYLGDFVAFLHAAVLMGTLMLSGMVLFGLAHLVARMVGWI